MLSCTLTVSDWNQTFIIEDKLSSEDGQFKVTGDLEGTIQFVYSMYYFNYDKENSSNSQADYSGFLVFDGQQGEKNGTFCMLEEGSYGRSGAKNSLRVIDNSGTGDFENITGQGSYVMNDNGMVLSLELK